MVGFTISGDGKVLLGWKQVFGSSGIVGQQIVSASINSAGVASTPQPKFTVTYNKDNTQPKLLKLLALNNDGQRVISAHSYGVMQARVANTGLTVRPSCWRLQVDVNSNVLTAEHCIPCVHPCKMPAMLAWGMRTDHIVVFGL